MINNEENFPEHIAIIMDGNRRWAKKKNLPIKLGHREGAKTLEKIVRYAKKIGVKYLTVYAFSTENWKRSEDEVNSLMELLERYLNDFAKKADTENIKVVVLGDPEPFNDSLRKSMNDAMERTKNNDGITFNICLNYGGRDEIVKATKNIAKKIKNDEISIDDIDEDLISKNLYTKNMPDPDLMIRTSGEMRTSGFLLWQLSYTEFIFLEKYWPDFDEDDLENCIEIYQKRHRKFGGN